MATSAANKGVKEGLFKKYGRLKSENVKDRYIEANLELLLIVIKSLELWLPLFLGTHS